MGYLGLTKIAGCISLCCCRSLNGCSGITVGGLLALIRAVSTEELGLCIGLAALITALSRLYMGMGCPSAQMINCGANY